MSKTLIIGSTTVDIIIKTPKLPKTAEDVNVERHLYSLGGCAYNVSHIFHLLKVPYILCTPQGTGIYGDYVRQALAKKNVVLPIQVEEESGACICLVEPSGERCFMAHHGVEYTFKKEWMEQIDTSDVKQVYICGLEIEDGDGQAIIDYLKDNNHYQIYFAPGPRIMSIADNKLKQLFELGVIIHLNEQEILAYTKANNVKEACQLICEKTHNDVIVTLGEKGCYYYHNDEGVMVEGYPAEVVDTIGAGDSHLGSYMALRESGEEPLEALRLANLIASHVVSIQGAELADLSFLNL